MCLNRVPPRLKDMAGVVSFRTGIELGGAQGSTGVYFFSTVISPVALSQKPFRLAAGDGVFLAGESVFPPTGYVVLPTASVFGPGESGFVPGEVAARSGAVGFVPGEASVAPDAPSPAAGEAPLDVDPPSPGLDSYEVDVKPYEVDVNQPSPAGEMCGFASKTPSFGLKPCPDGVFLSLTHQKTP